MRSVPVALGSLLLAALACSCSTHRQFTRAELGSGEVRSADRVARFAGPAGQAVSGYVTSDGAYHAFEGRARLSGDTLVFFRPAQSAEWMQPARPAVELRVAVAEVESVRSREVNVPLSILLGVSFAAGVLLVAAVSVAGDFIGGN